MLSANSIPWLYSLELLPLSMGVDPMIGRRCGNANWVNRFFRECTRRESIICIDHIDLLEDCNALFHLVA